MRVLLIGVKNLSAEKLFKGFQISRISSCTFLTEFYEYNVPHLIVFEQVNREDIETLRKHELLLRTPILILKDSFFDIQEIQNITNLPGIIFCNTSVALSECFQNRLNAIAAGKEKIMNARSGIIVKYALHFINTNISIQISRGFLAEKLGVTEDHLTRIFRDEMNISLWGYVNLYRLYCARELLIKTDDTVYSIAKQCGFADSAYFIRVFRKEFGLTPNTLRKTAASI